MLHPILETLAREFAPNPEDALSCVCVSLEQAGMELAEFDTVPGALREYFAEEGGQEAVMWH